MSKYQITLLDDEVIEIEADSFQDYNFSFQFKKEHTVVFLINRTLIKSIRLINADKDK